MRNSRPRKFSPPSGFALVVTISMMVLLVIVAVGLLSLSTISLRSSAISAAEIRAQHNARLALMMAIDRLQIELGPDQRISANGAVLELNESGSSTPVANPRWMGVWDSWRAGNAPADRYPDALSHHQTVFTGGRGDPIPDSMHPTYQANRQDHFRKWLVSLNPTDAEQIQAAGTLNLDAAYMPDETQNAIVLVGEGSLGESPDNADVVKVPLVQVDTLPNSSAAAGRYAWWVGDESQKASIIDDSYVADEANLTQADRLFRTQAPASTGTRSVTELENVMDESYLASIPSFRTLDIIADASNPAPGGNKPSTRFHDISTHAMGVLADVREGGLKRDLSTLLEREIVPLPNESGVSDINDFMLYRFPTKDDAFVSTVPQEVVPIQDLAAYYQLYSRGNSPNESGVRREDITARGVVYNSAYMSGTPHILGANFGTRGTSPIYPREYTAQYRHPRILKIQLLFSMFAEERDNWRTEANRFFPLDRLNSHELLIGITPAITFWNPTNLPVMMQMDPNQLVANMIRMGDLPLQFRFTKEDTSGNTFTSSYRTWLSFAGMQSGLNLYWSGKHSVFLEPGEVKTYSLPYSGDLSALKSQMGHSGHWSQWNSSFFMKTDEYYEGHEVREGWEPESFILLNGSAGGTNTAPDPLPGQPDMRDIVNNRLRFKRADRITIDIACNGGNKIIDFGARQSSYQRFDGNGISGTTSWDRGHFHMSSYDAGRNNTDQARDFNRELFRRGMPSGQATATAPSRTASSIIARSRNDAGWPFLQYSFMAPCETSEASNGGIMGGRKFPSRPFLHSSPLSGSPFLDANTGDSLYNFGWNWSANLINDVYEAPIQLNRDNQGFYGGGYTAESGTTHVIQQEIPVVPPISIASLSHARLGGHSVATEDGMPYGYDPGEIRHVSAGARRTVLARAVGHGGLLPHTIQAIGNSYAHPFLDADRTHKIIRRNLNSSVGIEDETFADHSYLANKALWDEFFFSSIAPQPDRLEVFGGGSSRDARAIADDFFRYDQPLPNRRLQAYNKAALDEEKLDELFSEYDQFQDGLADKIAAHLMVEAPFNINSTSVGAWKAVLSSLKGKPVSYLSAAAAMTGGDPSVATTHTGTPVGQVGLAGGAPFSGSPNSPRDANQWTSSRELTDDEIEELATAMVKQVKTRGPFLSLSEFVNRRLDAGNPELAAKGALQAALDDPDVSINEAFRGNGRVFTAAEVASMNPDFREAAEGPVAYGSSAYIDQADVLRNFAAQLTPRGDTFVIRAYGDSLDTNGKVEARAWCEAVIQRVPDYVDPLDSSSSSGTGDSPETKQADLQSISNQTFGRKMQIISFRWLNSLEV